MKITMKSNNIHIRNYIGTWHPIDSKVIDNKKLFLLEHDKYGDATANIIVDETGIVYNDQTYDGFSEEVTNDIKILLTDINILPDNNITVKAMQDYGYTWIGMLPLTALNAKKYYVEGKLIIYVLFPDNTELFIENEAELNNYINNGNLFGVEKQCWLDYLEWKNH